MFCWRFICVSFPSHPIRLQNKKSHHHHRNRKWCRHCWKAPLWTSLDNYWCMKCFCDITECTEVFWHSGALQIGLLLLLLCKSLLMHYTKEMWTPDKQMHFKIHAKLDWLNSCRLSCNKFQWANETVKVKGHLTGGITSSYMQPSSASTLLASVRNVIEPWKTRSNYLRRDELKPTIKAP